MNYLTTKHISYFFVSFATETFFQATVYNAHYMHVDISVHMSKYKVNLFELSFRFSAVRRTQDSEHKFESC